MFKPPETPIPIISKRNFTFSIKNKTNQSPSFQGLCITPTQTNFTHITLTWNTLSYKGFYTSWSTQTEQKPIRPENSQIHASRDHIRPSQRQHHFDASPSLQYLPWHSSKSTRVVILMKEAPLLPLLQRHPCAMLHMTSSPSWHRSRHIWCGMHF